MKPWFILLGSAVLAIHVGVVSSILLQDRPIIWPLHNDTIHRIGCGADFFAVYHAALTVRRGGNPYDNEADGVTPYFYPFRYLPIVAIAAQSLTYLSPWAAFVVWITTLELLLAALLATLWKRIADKRIWLAASALLLVSSPYFLEVFMGQFTFASITLCCLSLMWAAGWPLFCVSVLLKPISIAAVPALVREWRYWGHAIGAVLCVALLTAPHFLSHPDQRATFVDANFHVVGGLDAGNYGFVRLLNVFATDCYLFFVTDNWDDWIGAFRIVLLSTTALLVLVAKRKAVAASVPALLLAHFLSYQHVWEHHLSGVCVLGAFMLTAADRPKWFTTTVLVSLLVLALPTPFALFDKAKDPTVWDPSIEWNWYANYLVLLPKVVPTIALYLSAICYLGCDGLISLSRGPHPKREAA
jgi:hypothetical protein